MMPAWMYVVTSIWICLEALACIAMVGKPRKVKTGGEAAIDVVLFAWLVFLLIGAIR